MGLSYQEHLKQTKEQIQVLIADENARHEAGLELENKYHKHRIAELENIIVNLDKRFPGPGIFLKENDDKNI